MVNDVLSGGSLNFGVSTLEEIRLRKALKASMKKAGYPIQNAEASAAREKENISLFYRTTFSESTGETKTTWVLFLVLQSHYPAWFRCVLKTCRSQLIPHSVLEESHCAACFRSLCFNTPVGLSTTGVEWWSGYPHAPRLKNHNVLWMKKSGAILVKSL